MTAYRIDLLGPPRHWASDSTSTLLKRRDALILAYLALEGGTTRERLAELLWPESPPSKQGNNMRQLLLKLRERVGEDVYLEQDEMLWLSDLCHVDAVRVRDAYRKKEWAAVVSAPHDLLGSILFDSGPELDDWLERKRQWFRQAHVVALSQEVYRLDREGQHQEALELAERRQQLDPYNEDACRWVMTLQYQLGERAAALRTYQAFRALLWRELEVKPDAKTTALEREIQRSSQAPRAAARAALPELPLQVREPRLVGQERAWAALEDAWRRRVPLVYVCGEPGLGKSRLMQEFARWKGGWFQCSSRPGDVGTPYAARSRTVRKLLEKWPHAKLDGRILRQMGRIVPELLNGAEPLPLPDAGDRMFLEANFRLYEAVGRWIGTAVYDDGQYLDKETFGVGLYLEERCLPLVAEGRFPPILVGLQPGALDPSEEEILRERAERGLAAWIDLEPLSPESVREMVAEMGHGLDRIAGEITEYSGGSPCVVLEVVKELLCTPNWDGTFPRDFQLPRTVRALMRRKLERLSADARRIAQAIAVAGDELSLDLLASVTELPFEVVVERWKELERHHVVRGRWFTQGALPSAVLEDVPEPVRAALAEKIAARRLLFGRGGLW